jgi:phosphoesterase RecJ-like protein
MATISSSSKVAAWLAAKTRLLVLTHVRPDGDAFGSLYGAVAALRAAGKDCAGYLSTPLPERYGPIFPQSLPICHEATEALEAFDGILCLDTSNSERLALPPGLDLEAARSKMCNIDHHPGNPEYGQLNWIVPQAAATAEILAVQFRKMGWTTAESANCLLTGMIMDTGGFRFPNTSPQVLQTASRLMQAGADLASIMDAMFSREKLGRRQLEAELLNQATFAFGSRLAYAVLRPEQVAEHQLSPADLEGLIDSLRVIDSVEIACLIQPEADGVRFSLRARSAAHPVKAIAETLGGGGHLLAAGAKLMDIPLEEAEKRLLQLASKVLADS